MNHRLILALAALLALLSRLSVAQTACQASFESDVVVDAGVFTLADLLAPGACAALELIAREVAVGHAPLPGSRRVLTDNEAHSLWDVLLRRGRNAGSGWQLLDVPNRIVIRRRASESFPSKVASTRTTRQVHSAETTPTVRAGEAVTLVWEQGGIRLAVPAVSLEAGRAGEPVRARITSTGRVLRATIVRTGMVEAAL